MPRPYNGVCGKQHFIFLLHYDKHLSFFLRNTFSGGMLNKFASSGKEYLRTPNIGGFHMFRTRIVCLLSALVCLLGLSSTALALEVDCDATYCFSAADFSNQNEPLTGICVTGLPDAQTGTVMLGTRVLRPGDILTAEQVSCMTFVPLRTETDQAASVTYLPVYGGRVAPTSTMTISIRGKENKAPTAEDSTGETYKNLPLEGTLKAADPEGQTLIFTVTRQPRRGEVTVSPDGSFTYTPKKNKVGVDSFTYTATDPAGNVSREATVTITILKPTDAAQYTDTVDKSCRFAAEWMKNTGIFVAEQVNGECCFQPEKTVSRGEFVAMLTKALNLPVDESAVYTGDAPDWLKPYLAAAQRTGLTNGLPAVETFQADQPITGAEAALMLQNVLDLTVTTHAEPESGDAEPVASKMTLADAEAAAAAQAEAAPVWAADALTAMSDNGIVLPANANLTRGQVAEVLYHASLLAQDAPGMMIYQ